MQVPVLRVFTKKRFGQIHSYEEWLEPYLVSNTLELLDKEIPRLRKKIQSVQLCFSTDPFMYGYDEIVAMSIASITKLNEAGIKCTVLTKGILPFALSELSKDNEYGITLVSLNEDYRRLMEPGTAPYEERLQAMKILHDAGCKTWVSIEPYPTPNIVTQDLQTLLENVSFVDKIIFGRTNYSKEVSSFTNHKAFYNNAAEQVIRFCDDHGIMFHIKDGTISD